jgi:hypothetical protein
LDGESDEVGFENGQWEWKGKGKVVWLAQADYDFRMLKLAHMPCNSTAEAAQGCKWCVDAPAKLINTEWQSSAISQSLWGLEGSRNDPCTIA